MQPHTSFGSSLESAFESIALERLFDLARKPGAAKKPGVKRPPS